MRYDLAFHQLCPGAQWSCVGGHDNYDNFTWLDERPQPSQAECDAIMAEVLAEIAEGEVKANRQASYQAEADPLYFGWQRGENTEQAWLDKVAEIRARYPYPA